MKGRGAMVVAILLGLVAAIGVYAALERQKRQAKRYTNYIKVLKSSRTIEEGEVLTENHYYTEDIPEKFVPKQSVRLGQIDDFLGQKFIKTVPAESHILSDYFIRKIEDITKKIRPGLRAVSFPVRYHEGVSGLLRPGQRIDVWGSFRIKILLYPKRDPVTGRMRPPTEEEMVDGLVEMERRMEMLFGSLRKEYPEKYEQYVQALMQYERDIAMKGKEDVSITLPLLRSVQVAAIDSATDRFQGDAYKTVTVYVPPVDVGKVIWATNMGKLHVALRNSGDSGKMALPPFYPEAIMRGESLNPWLRSGMKEGSENRR